MFARSVLNFWILLAVVLAFCLTGDVSAKKENLPRVVILATGGTIAGSAETGTQPNYDSGQLSVDVLLDAVPELKKIARVSGEQVSNVGSQNMSDAIWIELARRINDLLGSEDVDGVVITHGTDTMEETAYFLNLVVKSEKPVVLTGSLRPSTALSADGPLNIYNAVAVAGNPDAVGRGVLVAINDDIHSARAVTKSNTSDVQSFISPTFGLVGTVTYGDVAFFRRPTGRHTRESEFSVKDIVELPRVDIIAIYEDVPGDVIDAVVKLGAMGIVTSGVGNGNMTDAAVEALSKAVEKGVVVVRASRVPTGYVGRNVELDDDKLGFVASYDLSPQKARILLRLALTKTSSPKQIQEYFADY